MADKKPSCPYKSYEETQVGVWEIPTIEDFKQFRESCLSDEGFVPAHSAKEFNLKVWTKKVRFIPTMCVLFLIKMLLPLLLDG